MKHVFLRGLFKKSTEGAQKHSFYTSVDPLFLGLNFEEYIHKIKSKEPSPRGKIYNFILKLKPPKKVKVKKKDVVTTLHQKALKNALTREETSTD